MASSPWRTLWPGGHDDRALTPAQHRAHNSRGKHDNCARGSDIPADARTTFAMGREGARHNRPDLAFHHEQLRHFHRPQSGAVAQNVGDVDKAMTHAV